MKAIAKLQARDLRQHMTDAERKLWSKLRRRQVCGYRFRRQHPIGPYIADFACIERMLAIEVDGAQHGEDTPHDRERKWFIENEGFRIVRFWNHDVLKDVDGVTQAIEGFLAEAPPPHPPPRVARGREKT